MADIVQEIDARASGYPAVVLDKAEWDEIRERLKAAEAALEASEGHIWCSDPYLPDPERGRGFRDCGECNQCEATKLIRAWRATLAKDGG